MKKIIFLLVTLVFQLVQAQDQQTVVLKVENFPIPIFTSSNLSLLILDSAWQYIPVPGDEIAVIDANGEIVGNTVVIEGHNGMPIWGDAPSTAVKDGLSIGERFGIIHWSKTDDLYFLYKEFKILTGSVTYIKDGFTIVNSLEKLEVYTRNSDVYYHIKSVLSESHQFSFYAQEKGEYSLKVSSLNSTLFEVENAVFEKGYYSFSFSKELPKGACTLDLIYEDKTIATKIFEVE